MTSPATTSDYQIRKNVVRLTIQRLQEELRNCQTIFDEDAIMALPRNKLIAYVTLIRSLNHHDGVCRQIITSFNPSEASIRDESEEVRRDSASDSLQAGGGSAPTSAADPRNF